MSDHDEHYETVAKVYSMAVFYDASGPFVKWLKGQLSDTLALTSKDTLADVGGGDGAFACSMAAAAGLPLDRIVVVEPSAAMIKSRSPSPVPGAPTGDAGPRLVNLGAQEWVDLDEGDAAAGPPEGFSCVLLKEVVHHFEAPRTPLLSAMRRHRVSDGGRIVIVTRPQTEFDYPLFPAARDVWVANQPSADELAADLGAAGFRDVRVTMLRYPLELPTDEWCKMVQNRFWSTFSHFSDGELAEGTAAIRRDAGGSDTLKFEERLIVITAVK